MAKSRSRTEIRQEFIRIRKALMTLQGRVDATMRHTYKELGWVRIHGRSSRRVARGATAEPKGGE